MTRVATVVAIPAAVLTVLVTAALAFTAGYASAAPPPLRLDVTNMTPRMITMSGPDTLTVAGTLTNTGTVAFDQIVARVQRSGLLGTESEVRDALQGDAAADAVTPQFTPVTDELGPGARVPVSLTVPLRGAPTSSLALADTGVYELLVNINGAPRGGDRARLAAVRLLLPVQSLPGSSGTEMNPPPPTPFSMIYPIADTPHRLSTVPGDRALLTDDRLATSFAPGGRLNGLVTALAQQGPVGSRVRAGICVAVDPDLLETALTMRTGYDVIQPDGAVVPGTGAAAAGQWLTQLTAATRGGCLIALPYADADLVALTRGGASDLAAAAIRDGRQLVAGVLGTPVLGDVTWPAGGVVDDATLATIGSAGGKALLLSADGIDGGRGRTDAGIVPVAASSQFAVLIDPLLAQAADGATSSAGSDPTPGGAAATSSPAGTDTPMSTQDVIGALAFRAQAGPAPRVTGPLVLAPPHRWAANGDGAGALLQAVGQLVEAGRLAPDPPAGVLSGGPAADTGLAAAYYPPTYGAQEIAGSVVAAIRSTALDITDLRSAVVSGSGVGISTEEMFTPLERGLVRPASASLRRDPAAATAAATAGAERIRAIRSTVRVLEPPSPYSLGTSNAPLPLTVANGLPVTVSVRIQITSTNGLRVAPIAPIQIPPLGRRQVSANAKVIRAGQFTVEAAVLTPNGGVLGPTSRLKVRSTVYGTITVWLTVGAGVLLVVLVARRIVRRIRGDRTRQGDPEARADPGAPVDPTDRGPASPDKTPPPRTSPPRTSPPRSPQQDDPIRAGRARSVPAVTDPWATDRLPTCPPRLPEPPPAPNRRP